MYTNCSWETFLINATRTDQKKEKKHILDIATIHINIQQNLGVDQAGFMQTSIRKHCLTVPNYSLTCRKGACGSGSARM